MTVTFTDGRDDPPLPAIPIAELETLAAATLDTEGIGADTEVAITLIDAAAMAVLNETHMGKAGPTDVLSFPLEALSPGTAPSRLAGGPAPDLGDVFICPEVVARNAAAAGVPFEDEIALMVVHGLLHLLGYDHAADAAAEQMEQRERDLLAGVGRVRP